MDDKERYLFDLQGYLVVKDVLNKKQLDVLNRAIDENILNNEEKQLDLSSNERYPMIWEEKGFRDLINDTKVKPYLTEMLGEEYRLDHEYAIIHQTDASQLGLHGGGTPHDPGQFYEFRNGLMFNGLTVVSYALTDIGKDDGGFCCIPGSHKSNYRTPLEFKDYTEIGPTVHIEQKAGDVLIFTEALTHGTFSWKGSHNRRSLLFKFCPAMISWKSFNRSQEFIDMLSDEQKTIVQTASNLGHRYYGKKRK